MSKTINIGINAFKRHNFRIMADKVMLRLKEGWSRRKNAAAARAWCREKSASVENWAENLDRELWLETEDCVRRIKEEAEARLSQIDLDLGGGGHYALLYFLTRYLRAGTVVETGVAAGWSSKAILTALKKNGQGGKLYSSDFPYFRYKNPERLIGYIVDEDLKQDWSLYIEGDRFNLPKIAAACGTADLFHYDSDKSYEGRDFALSELEPVLSDNAVIVLDDIQDNLHFRDYVAGKNWPWKVFHFGGKYLGITGPGFGRLDQ